MNEKNFKTKISSTEEDVIAFYNAYAQKWDNRFNASLSTKYFIERRWKSFQETLKHCAIQHNLAVELGVGTGIYINRVATLFDHIIAIDGSQNMLDMLMIKLKQMESHNISTVCANVINLAMIEDETIDCVYFFGLIEHIINLPAFIIELHRILKPGGVVIGLTPNGASPWYSLRSLIRGTGKHCSSDQYYTEPILDHFFIQMGFTKILTSHWGAVPAGIGDTIAKFLAKVEPFLEKSPLKKWLGGLTFAYRR